MSVDSAPSTVAPVVADLSRGWGDRPAWQRLGTYALVGLVVISLVRVITGANDIDSSGAIAAAIALAVPIGLAGLAGLWSERAGVVNIGLEGMMILGTWGGAFFGLAYGPWGGLLGAIVLGMVGGFVHAIATVVFGVDQIVSGVAINLLGLGAAAYLAGRAWDNPAAKAAGGGPTNSPPVQQPPTFNLSGVSNWLGDIENGHAFLISDIAGILRALVTNLSYVTIIAVLLFVLSWWLLWRTAFGLRLRSCGEAPQAAETLGINVYRYKFGAVLISGGLAGLAGGFISMVASNVYRDGQTGGRGFIGLASMIFGNWRPGGTAMGAALFGYTDAIQLRGRGDVIRAYLLPIGIMLIIWGVWMLLRRRKGLPIKGVVTVITGVAVLAWFVLAATVPEEFTTALPYVATLVVLALFSQRLRMPKADGLVYRKGEAK